jgi:hypothetical protein
VAEAGNHFATITSTSPEPGPGNLESHVVEGEGHDTMTARFATHTWEKNGPSYGSPPLEFTGPEPGCTLPYGR